MGYQLFGGQFWRCVYKKNQTQVPRSKIKTEAECNNNSNFSWVNRKVNFDNSFNGFLALFQTVSAEVSP